MFAEYVTAATNLFVTRIIIILLFHIHSMQVLQTRYLTLKKMYVVARFTR